jgi:hypothetical protein
MALAAAALERWDWRACKKAEMTPKIAGYKLLETWK